MRPIIRTLLLLCAAFLPLSSCYQHNGDIGSWFGSWKVTDITINGELDPNFRQNIFFAFQSQVFGLTLVTSPHISVTYYAEWAENDDNLFIDFSHTADSVSQDANYAFTPPAASHFANGMNVLHIERTSPGQIILSLDSARTKTINYYITKQ